MSEQAEEKKRLCPYCDEEILAAGFPFCKPCGVTLRYCLRCETVVKRDAEVCPQCGEPLD